MTSKKTYNYLVIRKSDGYRIKECYIEMIDVGVRVYEKENSSRLFLPYSNISMIIEYELKDTVLFTYEG